MARKMQRKKMMRMKIEVMEGEKPLGVEIEIECSLMKKLGGKGPSCDPRVVVASLGMIRPKMK